MRPTVVALLAIVIGTAPAAAIDLTCSGVLHTYKPRHTEATVAPQAAVVDLDRRVISTPVGRFDINKIADDTISFGGESPSYSGLTIFGTLDRLTGLMTVIGQKPGNTAQAEMYSELNCSKAKRLF
ncbi:hypothetical protein [Bradyrhizobium sp. WSM1743]|uniref:hypothetical protein n=1 Tax=Bradyrhizobium sp. WSM1743 TaxID=318996 RepID=UPI000483EAFE|nr:hypothetical protein [Bradyrhizobium sp. WSM1743]